MADNTLNALRAARRAMEQVVGPAVSSADGIVREQAHLVAQTLRVLEEQLPHLRERNAYELRRNIELGRVLREFATGALREELDRALATAERLAGSLGPSDRVVAAATAELTAVTAALVRSSQDRAPEVRDAVVRCVVTHAGDVIAGQRSWFAAQGWGGTGEVRPIEEMFAGSPDPSTHGGDDT